MGHEIHIISIVASDLFKSVCELLAFGEKLLKARKTTGHGMAASIDNFRIGQNEMDEPNMAKIIGHLVDKIRRPLPVGRRRSVLPLRPRLHLSLKGLVMAHLNTIILAGNLTRDPELRFTPSGAAVANFGVAWNRKGRDGEEVVSFFDVTAWNQLAENASESLTKGMRVVVYGRLDQRSWETQDGDRRSKVEIIADEIAPSLRWATAEVNRNERRDDGGGGGGRGRPVSNEPPAYDPNEEPF